MKQTRTLNIYGICRKHDDRTDNCGCTPTWYEAESQHYIQYTIPVDGYEDMEPTGEFTTCPDKLTKEEATELVAQLLPCNRDLVGWYE